MSVMYVEWIYTDIKSFFQYPLLTRRLLYGSVPVEEPEPVVEEESVQSTVKRIINSLDIQELKSSIVAFLIVILTSLLFVRFRLLRRI